MATVEINPDRVYFTFSRIRPQYSCGRTIESTLNSIRSKEILPSQLPQITLMTDGTNYFSLNNRRLFTFKVLKSEGLLQTIKARVKSMPSTKRMDGKYTPAKCSLTATLMRQKVGTDGKLDEENSGSECGGDSEGEEEDEKKEEVEKTPEVPEGPKIHSVLKEEGGMTTEKRQAVKFGTEKDNTVVVIADDGVPRQPQLFTEKSLRALNKKNKKEKPHLRMSDGKRKAKKKEAKWQQQIDSTHHMASVTNGKNTKPESGSEDEDSDDEEEEKVAPKKEAPYSLATSGGFGALLAGGKRRR